MSETNNKSFSKYLAWTVFFILGIYGPIGDYKYSIMVRTLYLILIPLVTFWIVKMIFKRFSISDKTNTILNRTLLTLIGIFFIYCAIDTAQQKTHWENTKTVLTRDGYENVGEDIEVTGVDGKHMLVLIFAALACLWYGFVKHLKVNSDL